MGLFRKKPDPIADREKQLKQQIAAIAGQIKHLSSRIGEEKAPPPNSRPAAGSPAAPKEPIFETVDDQRLRAPNEPPPPLGLYNERGVRKYDPSGWWRRLAGLFRAPPPSNPKLVNELLREALDG